jgi:hypothetical protein
MVTVLAGRSNLVRSVKRTLIVSVASAIEQQRCSGIDRRLVRWLSLTYHG